MIPHLSYTVSHGYQHIVASNDTDVVVLILSYTYFYISKKLKKLWILYGTGVHKRYVPMHCLAKQLDDT